MKRIQLTKLVFICLLIGFVGCSNDDVTETIEPEVEVEEINPMPEYTPLKDRPVKEKKDLLGYGYDITGVYASYESTREPIMDIKKYMSENQYGYYVSTSTSGGSYRVSVAKAWDYTKNLTNIFYDSYLNPIPENIAAFGGTILDSDIFKSEENSEFSEYLYGSVHVYSIKETYSLEANKDLIKSYFTESFKNDINKLSSQELIKKYGTHILTHYDAGGRLDLIYRTKIKGIEDITINGQLINRSYERERAASKGLMYAANTILVFWYYWESDPPTKEDIKNNTVSIAHIVANGGQEGLIPSGTYNLQKGYPKVDHAKWDKTINEDNQTLVKIQLDRLIPIYELIEDAQKKVEIKETIDKYIEARQIKKN